MKKISRKLLLLIVTLFVGVGLVACTTDTNLEDAVAALTYDVILAEGDTKEKVTKNLELPTADGDVTIAWASSKANVISKTGVVVRQDANTAVILTATLSYKEEDAVEVKFNLTVLAKEQVDPGVETTSIADFLLLEAGAEATIKGVVTSFAPHNSFGFADDTGAIAFRIGGQDSGTVDFKVGDELLVKVKYAVFNGLIQGEMVDAYEVLASDKTLPVSKDISDVALTAEALLEYQSHRVNLDNVLVTKIESTQWAYELTLMNDREETIVYRRDHRLAGDLPAGMDNAKVGDVVSIKNALVTWFNVPQLGGHLEGEVVAGTASPALEALMDELLVKEDLAATKLPGSQTEAGTLTLPEVGTNGSTFVWEVVGENAALIDLSTGAFTMPLATEDLVLKLTATKGTVELTKQFIISLIVDDGEQPVETSFTELFINQESIGKSYTDVTYQGVEGVEWAIVHGRDADTSTIEGGGVMLRRADEPSSLSATFVNGMDSFSFSYTKAFTGSTPRTYSVDVTHNELTETHVLPAFGDTTGADETVYAFALNDLALEGPVTVKIYATGADGNQQAVFGNFVWSSQATTVTPDPEEPVVEGFTLALKGGEQLGTEVPEGLIDPALYSVVNDGAGTPALSFIYNDATTKTIFNNSSNEIRLYATGELVLELEGYVITNVTIELSRNNGTSINNGATFETLLESVDFAVGLNALSIKNVTGQSRIKSITVTYQAVA